VEPALVVRAAAGAALGRIRVDDDGKGDRPGAEVEVTV
jgi:hypothetical protein